MAATLPLIEVDTRAEADLAAHAAATVGVHGAGPADVLINSGNIGLYAPSPDLSALVTLAPASSARNTIQPTSSSAVPLIVKGAASQAASLQEWQNSAGTAVASVDANGAVRGSAAVSNRQVDLIAGGGAAGLSTSMLRVTNGSAEGQITDLSIITGGITRQLRHETRVGQALIPGTAGAPNEIQTGGLTWNGDQVMARTAQNTKTPLIVKGAASQTADLQQWQDSAGGAVVKVSLSAAGSGSPGVGFAGGGAIYDTGGATVRLDNRLGIGVNASSTTLGVQGYNRNDVVADFRGANSTQIVQTADLLRLYTYANDANPVLKVGADGTVTVQDSAAVLRANITPSAMNLNVGLNVNSVAAVINPSWNVGSFPFYVRGAVSQTGDLQQWQSSAGAALVKVLPGVTGGEIQAGGFIWGGNSGSGLNAVRIGQGPNNGKAGIVFTTLQDTMIYRDAAGVLMMDLLKWKAANVQTTVGAAGGAAALPATPVKFVKIVDDTGATLVIPAYNP